MEYWDAKYCVVTKAVSYFYRQMFCLLMFFMLVFSPVSFLWPRFDDQFSSTDLNLSEWPVREMFVLKNLMCQYFSGSLRFYSQDGMLRCNILPRDKSRQLISPSNVLPADTRYAGLFASKFSMTSLEDHFPPQISIQNLWKQMIRL